MNPQYLHLQTHDTSYILHINAFSHLTNLYYGAKLEIKDDYSSLLYKQLNPLGTTTVYDEEKDPSYSLDHTNLELATYGKGDYRPASLVLQGDKGFSSDFKVSEVRQLTTFDFSHEGLPTPHDVDEGYEIDLIDDVSGVKVTLRYLVFKASNVIARSIKVHQSDTPIRLEKVMSLNLDLYNQNFDVITTYGTWANEVNLASQKVFPGTYKIATIAGPSSNRHNPFIILKSSDGTFDYGHYYGCNFIYSGPFELSVHLSSNDRLRLQAGINSETFSHSLNQGDFISPWAVLSFSRHGQNGLSHNFHTFIHDHVVRKEYSRQVRPILLNNWEATYFKFSEGELVKLMKKAKSVGIEMFVLDDGWFSNRDNDMAGLGNYEVNRKKLPHGLKGLSHLAHQLGLKFGLWFEPEMVSEDSDIYRKHPEWIIHIPSIKPSKGRHQYAFDLTRKEVQDYIINQVSQTLESAAIEYVKWDYNRNLSDLYSHSGHHSTFFYDYTKGLYTILATLTSWFPNVLWEGCASGGNRFDLGVLHYFDQIWASDCSDAFERVRILKNLALMYPLSVISSHVSAVPNHQTLRTIDMNTRFNVSFFCGGFGYELDLNELTPLELKSVKAQVSYYQRHRHLIHQGTYYELANTSIYHRYGFALINLSQNEAIAALIYGLTSTLPVSEALPPLNINPTLTYQVEGVKQVSHLAKFGGLLKMVLPKFIKPNGLVIRQIAKRKSAEELIDKDVKESYLVDGSLLKNGALRLYPQWSATGVSEKTRVLGDFGSVIYHIYSI